MLTLQRFQTLLDSYGADLRRWPEETRVLAQGLLQSSSAARALLEDERALDDMIAAASSHEGRMRWGTGDHDVAMARLRARVGARIAATEIIRPSPLRPWVSKLFGRSSAGESSVVTYNLRWVGLATTGAFAVIAGLMIGAMYEASPATPGALATLLQPAAVTILEN